MPAGRRSAQLGTLLGIVLLAAGCGTATPPAPLKAMKPDVPADLCSTLPAATVQGLISTHSSDDTGDPTAACALRSPDATKPRVQAVVTWLQTDEEENGDQVLESQCQAIDHLTFHDVTGFQATGARKACAASGKIDGADSATLAAVAGTEVVTVRLSSLPPGAAPVLGRAEQMLEGVISSLAGDS